MEKAWTWRVTKKGGLFGNGEKGEYVQCEILGWRNGYDGYETKKEYLVKFDDGVIKSTTYIFNRN